MINFFNRLETFPGGGTFWGLGRLLTKAKGFDEVAYVLNHFCFFFCRQCLPDSTIPQGLVKQADVAFCFMPGA
jgi:hypothetical protein